MKVTDIITLEQIQALRAAGLVVVHQVPTHGMHKAGGSAVGYADGSVVQAWHRMVAESIRLQNLELERESGNSDDEARAILRDADAWIDWDEGADKPDWRPGEHGGVIVDGRLSAKEMRALLHFAPKDEA